MNNSRMQNYCNRNMNQNNSCCNPTIQSYPKIETSKDMVLAMAYVPWQCFGNVLEPDQALKKGTMFPELYKPFVGCKGGHCS